MPFSWQGNAVLRPSDEMPLKRVLACVLLLSCVCVSDTYSQTGPLKGVVWDAPAPPTASDLVSIREAGVEAIRLPILDDLSLIHVADTLGLQLFQDLPILLLSAEALLDTLEYAKHQLTRAHQMYSLHPSAHRFGVSTKSDTSTPLACEYFRELAEWSSDLTLYYVSAFASHDQCSSYVDLVLLDTRRNVDPDAVLNHWKSSTPVGLSSFGKKVDPDAFGLRQEFSPESQERFLEDQLPKLLSSTFSVIFVYRWQDSDDTSTQWGLIDTSGRKRIAYQVLNGIYAGTQSIFALDLGEYSRRPIPTPLILGWMSIVLVVLVSLWYGRFPEVMWSYVMNKYPHRDTLYRESALLAGASFFYVIAQGIMISGAILILIEACRGLGMIEAIAILLNPYILERIINLTSDPFLPTLVVISLYLMVTLFSSLLGAWGSWKSGKVKFEHFFVIKAMNNTPLGILLPIILVTPGLNERQSEVMTIVLTATWIILSIYCNIQAARNFSSLSREGLSRRVALVPFILPLLSLIGLTLLLCIPYTREYIVFWWHLSFKG